ncbi:hypothetical protein [Agrococcus baldri]|uniref:Uncharacterized protein n=1 Tax=Agrococcus baldri TaxID=153730 RepID=A0AA87RHY1_9MICO|nr:hypothetical protein [Agrococcus baldri]GEK80575.1 hypothetical protein ABA31_19260 [Agrococcus baldri]
MTAKESRLSGETEAAQDLGTGSTPNDTATRPQSTAARLSAVDDLLESAWAGLASCTLDLHRLREANDHLFAIYMLGFDAGIAAQDARVRQAEADSDRYYLRAMNAPDKAAEIERRLDVALDRMPDEIQPHGQRYFERALSAVMRGDAA